MKISYSFGIMDLFHYGHLKALQAAAKSADLHVVGLVADRAARQWVGNIVSTEQERRMVLDNILCVDWVMPQQNLDPTENLKKLHYIYPDAEITLFRGDGITMASAREYLQSIGGKIQTIDYYERLSPMEILKALDSRTGVEGQYEKGVSTKADTLFLLKDRVKKSRIEDIVVITAGEYASCRDAVIQRVKGTFQGSRIVVRSSSASEDNAEGSNAGHYESVLDVHSDKEKEIKDAIDTVLDSYEKDAEDHIQESDQVLIQRQTMDVKYSGVVFTRDIQRNRPYYVINYDDTGSTDAVTSGQGGKTVWISIDAKPENIPREWRSLFAAVQEVESILSRVLLDIEFAITSDGTVIIFQARPLVASYKFGRMDTSGKIIGIKNECKAEYLDYTEETGLHLMSDMAFWNPAEIIGNHPKSLDYSLYQYIITHRSWNEGLVPMGYRKVLEDLMCRFGGKPYICVELAFQSLIPSELTDELADKLLAYYVDKLKSDVSAHDKIEFEVVLSCFDFSTKEKLGRLADKGFAREEIEAIEKSLRKLTVKNVRDFGKILKKDLESLETLEKKRESIEAAMEVEGQDIQSLIYSIHALLDSVKQNGTRQFSRQARNAFIAKALCTSLVDEGYWSKDEYSCFMESVKTVAGEFKQDYGDYIHNDMPEEEFRQKYGHLRAGTYDITSPRYDRLSLKEDSGDGRKTEKSKESRWRETDFLHESVRNALIETGIELDAGELLAFAKEALEQREYFKFIFTKSLSRTLELIAQIGDMFGFKREEMAYFRIEEVMSLSFYGSKREMKGFLSELLLARKTEYKNCEKLILPSIIQEAFDFDCIVSQDARPNFITEKVAVGEVAVIESGGDADIRGKIVVIEKADPGYDWIFTRGIAGLVTRYGGVASHMAIRCAEFDIPAAIGCGEQIFSYVLSCQRLRLDCKNGMVQRR